MAGAAGVAGAAGAAEGVETVPLSLRLAEAKRREQALREENRSARAYEPYLVVDTRAREITLKARGRILRAFTIRDAGSMPAGIPLQARVLSKVEPLKKIARPKMKPGQGEAAAALAAKRPLWGPHRMPVDYDLVCREGVTVHIRALCAKQPLLGPVAWLQNKYRRLKNRYREWRSRGDGRGQELLLWLDEDDSRLLLWSLPRRLEILVR